MSEDSDPKRDEQAVADQHAAIGVDDKASARSFQRTRHPDAQWFADAGLGLFIHWGISSVQGAVQEGIDLSWGMVAGKPWGGSAIPAEEYFGLAERFNPDKYDPDKWLRAACGAGFRYAVFTTRHHDGYAMWPSRHGGFGVPRDLGGRDLVGPYVDACRRNGLKVGLYYSPPDWHYNRDYMSFHYRSDDQERFPGRPHYNAKHEVIPDIPAKPDGFEESYRAYVHAQVVELLSDYGQIDVLFFDGGPDAISMEEIRNLQPGIVVNPRMHGYGDYETPECQMPEQRPEGWWELCEGWPCGGWGYDLGHEKYLPTGHMLSRLAQVRAWCGNYLLNVGPKASGELPDIYYERIRELGAWMQHSSASVFDTDPVPDGIDCEVPLTAGNGILYLHALPDFRGDLVLRGIAEPVSVTLLRTNESVQHTFTGNTLTVSLASSQRTELDDVVAVVVGPAYQD